MSTTGVSAAHGAVTRERYRVNYQTQERSEQEEGMRMHFSEMYLFVQVETNLRLFFFNKFMPTGILMRFCIRPFPLKAFHPLQSFIHSSVYPSISLGERCFHLVAMYVRHCGIKSVFFYFSTGTAHWLDVITASVMCYFCCCVRWPLGSSGNGYRESGIQPSDGKSRLIIPTAVSWSKLLKAGKYIINVSVWRVCLNKF